ncbi:3-hydroxy-9,10-secoandrosta-1,3,5(10)-triene-9,17-dione monooxygenase reductase subunit [Phytohabitans rumicis]|uniref:Monooxygenase n=1 Tax=Phytohabitans rumicis TaxID=1076125 RepID=A0A6V8LNI0_9ACTN|nr:3-hydroxy-9,10-secoandrosta-1,3,5(10)-triene-9,17-dione monooxygenase reductase subunit [Phytohabitans rumicis]GFJ96418.1 monooxygenase [Phytohabitans rumicis]
MSLATVDTHRFRQVLGHFCTGVTVVTATADGVPVGFACQAFAALSLDPPLVLFCPRVTSETWRGIRQAGGFCVNVLAEEQRDLSRAFGSGGGERFTGVGWTPSPRGHPVLDGVLTWADCAIEAVHPGGDHDIVIGRVAALGECRDARPLLFYQGRYTGTAKSSPYDPPDPIWPRPDDWI